MGTFADLGLKKDIVNVLSSLKYKKTFEVQDKIIPLALKGENIVFTSQTGSGKTLTFLLGFLGKINPKQGIQMLVIAPARELCVQIGKELKTICDPLGISVGTLYGGRDLAGDKRTTSKKNQIIVGTPGRLIQHINEKHLKVGEVKFLVYDESDRMFDNGFYGVCSYIKKRVSKNVQIILSSATVTDKVDDFVNNEIKEFKFLEIGFTIPKTISQLKYYCEKENKNDFLIKYILNNKFRKILIFCNTKLKTYLISEFFYENGFKSKPLNSDFEQKDRQNYLNLFRDGKIAVLAATDVAARGLHIKNVDVVINYDVPTREEFYIHRIGRTGRNNKKGIALTLICKEDEVRFKDLEISYKLEVNTIKG